MAKKKRNTRQPTTPRRPQADPQPSRAGDEAGETPKPAGAAPEEGTAERPGPPVAGIGASAGGLDAFEKLFTAMPTDTGIAFVLIPHLDPTHESLMVELLARHTRMPVVEAADGTAALANHVYIIPPNKYLTISGGVLHLAGPVEGAGPQTAIDLFLRSLAADKHEKAICVILSGTGARGTLGLKAVKAAGGLAVVQDPATASHPAMPQSAIATGLADRVLPVEQMPQALTKYIQHDYVNGDKAGPKAAAAADELNPVLAMLLARTRLDFRPYRKKLLARRIERRMSLKQFDRLADYVTYLREYPDEVRHLSRDLLITVTSFFRDPEAWLALETDVIAPLVRAREPEIPLRVWSVSCATGEEPYSLGMLFLEQFTAAEKVCPVQIFATDVDEDALETARQGTYPEGISADVSADRLARFFTRVSDSSVQVRKQLREIVTFARQNLLTDAPFSKLDLVVCRNVMIYLEPETQNRVIELLHFALNDGGILFLGPSETIGRSTDLFVPISAKWRIYRRIGPTRANNLHFPAVRTEQRPAKGRPADRPQPPPRLAELAQDTLLRRFAVACVVINRNYEVLHFAGPTEDYLLQPGGPPTHNLMALARPGLEPKLRVVIQRTIRQNSGQGVKNVMMRHRGVTRRVSIDVEPLHLTRQTEGLLLVSFQEQSTPAQETLAEEKARTQAADTDMVRQLEQELETTREDLQSTIEELESANEELKASNEEIVSMNEELQSANEELESSEEELQSLNEELNTVNNQLQDKVQELEAANNDMVNLFNATDIATVFLDTGFRIKRFTPAATLLFKLIATDIGRPLGDIVKRFTDDDLLGDAGRVVKDLMPREQEVRTEDGNWYGRRIIPYRTPDNRVDGVVVTFVDVTERKHAADAVVRRLAAIVESSADAIISKDLDGTIRTWNQGAERLFGYTPGEAGGRSIRMTVPDDRVEEWTGATARLARGEHVGRMETVRVGKDGRRVPVELTYSPLRDDNGKIVGVSATARDITTRKRAEQSLRDSEEQQRAILASLPAHIAVVDRTGRIVAVNPAWERFAQDNRGVADRCNVGANYLEVCRNATGPYAQEAPKVVEGLGSILAGAASEFEIEYPCHGGGQERWFLLHATRLHREGGGAVLSHTAITNRVKAEQRARADEHRLQTILNTAADGIITIDKSGIIQSVNASAERMFGYAAAEMVGQNVTLLMPSLHRELHGGDIARYLRTGETHIIGRGREVQARRKDGSDFPAELAANEVDHLGLYIGTLRDLSERKQLERDVVQAASLEQRRIGRDLHDSVGQELTALNILTKDLAETLRSDPATAAQLVERIAQGLQRGQQELRAVLRGLLPVSVDAEGLMAALAELAERTRRDGNVACTFDCPEPVAVADNLVATHLYLIAQEAVLNAVKHARARTVRISLTSDHVLRLGVQDDGIGMPAALTQTQGLGLRIMRNRATIIGATLTIEPAQPAGTVVTCLRARRDDEGEKDESAGPGADRR